nr:uncharacterized protein SMIM43 isoform X7 [Pan paniscus]
MQFSHFRTKSKSRAAALDWCSGDHSCNDSLGLQKEGWNNGRWKLSANGHNEYFFLLLNLCLELDSKLWELRCSKWLQILSGQSWLLH